MRVSFFPSHLASYTLGLCQRQLISPSIYLRRTNNKSRHTAPKSRTNSVAKIGFGVSPANPTSRLRPNPSQIPHLPTLLPLPHSPHDPDRNPTLAHPRFLQTPTGTLPSSTITAFPKPISPPRVSRPPYQVSSPALPPLSFPLYPSIADTPRCCF
jgi:hypothetical protein